MSFPHTVRYSTLARLIYPSCVMLTFVTLFTLATVEFFTTYQEMKSMEFEPHFVEETIKRLILETKILNSKLNECQTNTKARGLSETVRLIEKVNEGNPEKWQQLKNNQTITDKTGLFPEPKNSVVIVNREFFNYMAVNLRNTSYPGVENYTRYTVSRLGLSPLVDVDPLIPEFGPVINDVLSFQYPISVAPCRIFPPESRNVFIIVNSAPGNFKRRQMIRQTWLNHLKDLHQEGLLATSGFAFTLGLTKDKETQTKIEEEAKTYGDIIQIGMADFYRNLSLKVAGQFNWLYRYCTTVEFVAKVDDDVYVNVRNLANFVKFYHQSNLSMFGSSLHNNILPERDGKWGISFEDWPWNEYPPYLLGPAVLFHGSTIVPLLAAFQTTPMIRFDDLYYTGLCTEKAGIKVHHSSDSTSLFQRQRYRHLNLADTATGVLSMELEMSGVPTACNLRRFIAWLVDYDALMPTKNHMNSSHIATNNFYRNVTQCIITKSNGIQRAVNSSKPVHFDFSLIQNRNIRHLKTRNTENDGSQKNATVEGIQVHQANKNPFLIKKNISYRIMSQPKIRNN